MESYLANSGHSNAATAIPPPKNVPKKSAAYQSLRIVELGALAAAGYYLGSKLGFALTPEETPISTLWPPNAILLAILLLVPKRRWWVPLLAVLPVHLFIQLGEHGIPIATSIGWFISNTGEALLGAALIRRFVHPDRMFESVRGTLIFLAFGVILAPLSTSFVDAANVIVTGWGAHFWSLWTERSISNTLTELIVVPVVMTFWTNGARWIKEATPVRYLEAFALGVGLVVVSFVVFNLGMTTPHNSRALIYLPLSLLLWAAFRFGSAGVSVSVATIALISIEGAIHGRGPFISGSLEGNVHSLQILLCTVATPFMLLTAVTTERRRIENSLREVAQKLIGAQEEERQRIGRELHDDIGQQLAILELGLRELKNKMNDQRDPGFTQLIEKAGEVSRSTRELSHGLHPSSLEYLGLESALRRLCNDLASRRSIRVRFEADRVSPETPSDVALCVYRISQEALQNVVRHSGASVVSVNLVERTRSIRLRITDNGAGFDLDKLKHTGLGLIGMRERLRPLNGEIWIYSSPSTGTTLEVTIPLNGQQNVTRLA